MQAPRPLYIILAWMAVIVAVYALTPSASEDAFVDVRFCPGDCEEFFLATLQNSTKIACAFYDLDFQPVMDILHDKDAQTLVFEENHAGFGTPVRSKGLMHHKFCVLDGRKVLTGSMNPTHNGVVKNDNNVILIHSADVAAWYAEEIEDLGEGKSASGGSVPLENGSLTVLFCPQQDCQAQVLAEIEQARESITFMTFSFTSDEIGNAILDAYVRDVVVQGVFETRMNPEYSEFEKLQEWGVPIRKDGNPNTMHHKVFIIDNETVITGSYNPTWSGANRNDENLLIIHDSEIAAAFAGEFGKVWADST